MSFSSKKKQKLFTEINITPLTDIFLVLLIIMMVVAPSFQSMDNAVDVPEVNNGINIENSKVTVSITKDGAMYVNGENVKPSQLTDKLLAAKTDDEKSEVDMTKIVGELIEAEKKTQEKLENKFEKIVSNTSLDEEIAKILSEQEDN